MSKLRDSARGQQCLIRIPGVCNHNPETVALCHLNGAGMGMKWPDLFGAFGCSNCHDVVDFRREYKKATRHEVELMHLHGMFRTQKYWLDNGLIKIN